MRLNRIVFALGIVVSFLSACGEESSLPATQTGLRVAILAYGIDGFSYKITRVTCAGEFIAPFTTSLDVALRSDETLPGELDALVDHPFDGAAEFRFAEAFFPLDAGCYDIALTPYGDGKVSCTAAVLERIAVVAEQTTEKLLISQCVGVNSMNPTS